MRITNKMLTGNYMDNLNSSLSKLTKLNEKVSTGRRYMKASEDPATALKALAVRQNLSRISLYQDNISEAQDTLIDVESAVAEINSVITGVTEQILQGKSDTYSEIDRQTVATVLRNYQDEILNISNSKSADKYIFGGSDMDTMPFDLSNGVLYYHGIDVDSNTGFLEESIYYDIGLGLKTDASGKIIEGTAFNISNPGSQIFGTGTDINGIPNNLYNLIGDIAQLFEDNSLNNINSYTDKLEEVGEKITLQYVNIGQKANFLDFLANRLKTNEFNAQKKQNKLECIDQAEGILNYKTQEVAYNAALAMGSKIIQASLLDYLK